MRKLALDLDSLVVESFETDMPQGRGTVIGAEVAAVSNPNCSAIDACPSAWNCSVNGTCMDQLCGDDTNVASCAGTCDFNTGCGGCSGPYC